MGALHLAPQLRDGPLERGDLGAEALDLGLRRLRLAQPLRELLLVRRQNVHLRRNALHLRHRLFLQKRVAARSGCLRESPSRRKRRGQRRNCNRCLVHFLPSLSLLWIFYQILALLCHRNVPPYIGVPEDMRDCECAWQIAIASASAASSGRA